MLSRIKYIASLAALLSLYAPAATQEQDESKRSFVGLGAGLNPLCLLISEEHFACVTQASLYAAFDLLHLYAKFDENYIFLSSRRSDINESNKWGPRQLYFASWNTGFYQSFFETSRLPLIVGIGVGRYTGHNVVQHRIYSSSPDESATNPVSSSDDYAVHGTVFHAHFEIMPRSMSDMGSSFKLLVNLDGFHPDRVGEDAFSTGTVVTMPTPQIFWGLNF